MAIGKYEAIIFDSYDFGGETNYQRESYATTDGDVIVDALYNPRTITVSGHIIAKSYEERFNRRRELYRIFDGKTQGTLTYTNDTGTWTIKAVPRLPTIGSCVGNYITKVALYFEAPNFYFTASEEKTVPLYSRSNQIKLVTTETNTLPAVFTTRIMTASVTNDGSLGADPTIIIAATGENEAYTAEESDAQSIAITITAESGDSQTLELEYTPTAGEVITINCDEMTITSSLSGSLLGYLTIDSDFLTIPVGSSTVQIANNTSATINAYMTWRDREVGV